MKLRCYCCGTELGETFCLVTMQKDAVDRVFVCSVDHAENFDDCTVQIVTRAHE